jgi:sulfate permease, SulP family
MQNISSFFNDDFTTSLQKNLKSGVTVALVSIPLSIAISIASGAGPVPGIITGFWATMIAALFGGSKFNVIGPAGALTSVLFAATLHPTLQNLNLNTLSLIAIFSGLIILIIYILKLHKYISSIPESIVHGFAAGVAFIIAGTQLREAFGIANTFKPSGHFLHDIMQVFANLKFLDISTLIVFSGFFLFLLAWKKYVKSIPGVIPASVMGIILGFVFDKFGILKSVLTIGQKYGELKLQLINFLNIESLQTVVSNPSVFLVILKISFVVAIISILETLITARMGDALTNTKFDSKKETFGLSLANVFSGFFGGLPATGVFIRTGLNIKSGATNIHSALIAGFLTGVGAFFLMPIFKHIPMSVIAAILMMTAIGLIDLKHFKEMFSKHKLDFYVAIITALFVVISDPLIGVLTGTFIYFAYLYKNKVYKFLIKD